ncbi:MAG: type I DNA topoisomerase [Planctomycetaceae bacterium]|jgi:DNA topoisomerase-1|nr:type I DNA topoisomerase [Planctomycetaceae bacterium]
MVDRKNSGISLVIVESPEKAKNIGGFVGKDYLVEASVGHIRDLPRSAKDIPASIKKEPWARLGVNVDNDFEPVYVISSDKTKQIKKLKDLLKQASSLYLATDEDREGEAISWHLLEVLKPTVPVHRLTFHEITKEAILDAIEHPRTIDYDLVQAQETRRIIDRLFGYEVSPLLWYKVLPKLSAGRVQSVAVRLIVDRERERRAFHNATYWDLLGRFSTQQSKNFDATLVSVGGRKIPVGKDFDANTGKLLNTQLLLMDEAEINKLRERLLQPSPTKTKATVTSVDDKPYTTDPYAPFTTSTLQQEANRKLGLTARTTMGLAQRLYENGYITYMRTDSTTLSNEAINAARTWIKSQYGDEYLPPSPRDYKTDVKNAQEAHEAIRPAGRTFELPESLRNRLSYDEFRLYDMIWKRTIACQMTNARLRRTNVTLDIDDARFTVSGKTIEFAGYMRAYVEGSDDPDAELADKDIVLPPVKVGDVVACNDLEPKSHTTKPPARYTEAALTATLTKLGIGRPSTYASIIETILNRNYVFKKGTALVPTWVAFAVCQLLEDNLTELVDYDFTAKMEDQLDSISRGEMGHLDYLKQFYFGDKNRYGLKPLLENKRDSIDAREVNQFEIGKPPASDGGETNGDNSEMIVVRIGKYGPFLQQGERRTSVPPDLPPDELTVEKALEFLNAAGLGDEPLGICSSTGKPIYIKAGRFGPYVQRGTNEDGEKPQNASLLKGMLPEEVTLDIAIQLLSLPRELGERDGEQVLASNGPYGPYVKCGKETRSLAPGMSPLDVTYAEAVDLLAQPKFRNQRGTAKRSEPLVQFAESPVTGKPVQLLSGRYGAYLTDGQTNVTLPKDVEQSTLTEEQALQLLADKAAKGPSKRRPMKKATKKATKKAAKKTTAKKVTKKTTKKAVKK